MSHRKQQRESVLLRAVQEVLSRGLADPRIRGLLTATGIRLSDDGKHAMVSISVLPEEHSELTMHGLRAATPHIRKDVMKKVRIREMPSIEFRLDDSAKRQAEVLGAINRAVADVGDDPVEPGDRSAKDEGGVAPAPAPAPAPETETETGDSGAPRPRSEDADVEA